MQDAALTLGDKLSFQNKVNLFITHYGELQEQARLPLLFKLQRKLDTETISKIFIDFPLGFHKFSMSFPGVVQEFAISFPLGFHEFSISFPWVFHCFFIYFSCENCYI